MNTCVVHVHALMGFAFLIPADTTNVMHQLILYLRDDTGS